MTETIAAVVVTFNRKKLLKECLYAIISQSHKPDAIFIIDNHSSDGTRDMLISKGLISPDLKPASNCRVSCLKRSDANIPMNIHYMGNLKNTGGAGGFKQGIEAAYENGYDWIWIMDDDVEPLPDALEKLLKKTDLAPAIGFLASRVVGTDLKRSMNLPAINDFVNDIGYPDWERHLSKGVVKIKSATFVSILLNSEAVKMAGLPRASFFIWGDDTEYTLRISLNYKLDSFLVGDSVVVHKRKIQKNVSIHNASNPYKIRLFYYFYRNHYIIARNFYLRRDALFNLIDSTWTAFQLLLSKDRYKYLKVKTIVKGLLHGILFK